MIEKQSKISIIRMFHVHKNYGAAKALIDITLDVPKNELLFISGPSGAGKTSLLKLLYFGEAASEGQVLIDGMNLSRISHNRIPILRRKFGVIFQDYKLIRTKTVFDNIAIVLEAMGKKRRFVEKKVRSVLRTVGMENSIHSLPPTLSGGNSKESPLPEPSSETQRLYLQMNRPATWTRTLPILSLTCSKDFIFEALRLLLQPTIKNLSAKQGAGSFI